MQLLAGRCQILYKVMDDDEYEDTTKRSELRFRVQRPFSPIGLYNQSCKTINNSPQVLVN
ncbi:hypothetical protein BBBOND_0303520 [Babesia bigemina]|uniref:Uncharacterized protein n=1 Tax=Babesia bigemina TaxID=5866 RepID=A0A061D7C7_BABBI|nr:hypothetical protein BBBOND_0303520 [Babesia bigemina]CDR96448.1 hypothetical protein BBBOND_0303520 [Babesia bigemina]|eukprot:XP_012768634.1 hypothetical protein BBBOND_0303520 [Babesia bigemina]